MGWRRELAVVQHKDGSTRPLTTTDIARSTRLDESDVRRSLDQLQDAGFVERRGKNGGPMYKGKVEIYAWATPRPSQNGEQRAPGKPAADPQWVPEDWKPLSRFVKRSRRCLPRELPGEETDTRTRDDLARALHELADQLSGTRTPLETGAVLARTLETVDMGCTRFLDGVGACARPNKEDITEIKGEKYPHPPQSAVGSSSRESSTDENREEEEEAPVAIALLPKPEEPTVLEAEVITEEPTFQEFAEDYPGELDPDSRPLYAKLKPEDRAAIQTLLPTFKACERWQTPQFIPKASNFIRKRYWEFPPPPGRAIESPKLAQQRQSAKNVLAMVDAMTRGRT